MEKQPLSALNEQSKSFNRLIRLLIWKFKPQQLFCFATSSITKQSTSCFTIKSEISDCHYSLLMVKASDVPTSHTVQKFINSRFKAGEITVLCHDQETVLNAIRAKNRFFVTIYSHAQLLYSKDELVQAEYIKSFSPINALKKAERKFAHYTSLADAFLAGATHCFKNQNHNACTVMLHHALEQCATLLVGLHLSYQPETNSLYNLVQLCRSFSAQPQQLLLTGTEDKRLFDILIKGCSDARFGTTFQIATKDVEQLFIRVSTFIKLTRMMCKDKIEQLHLETLSYKQPHFNEIH